MGRLTLPNIYNLMLLLLSESMISNRIFVFDEESAPLDQLRHNTAGSTSTQLPPKTQEVVPARGELRRALFIFKNGLQEITSNGLRIYSASGSTLTSREASTQSLFQQKKQI